MKILLAITTILFLIFSNVAISSDAFSFGVTNPYPVCVEELRKIEPNIPESVFKKVKESCTETTSLEMGGTLGSCDHALALESVSKQFNAFLSFYRQEFPKLEREIFADKIMKKPDHKAILKRLDDTLVSCQKRTEKLHNLAAEASKDIYDNPISNKSVPKGYELINAKTDVFIFPDSDVKAYVIRPKSPNTDHLPPIISFAGTKSFKSAISDLSYGADQLKNSKATFLRWVNSLETEKYNELIITGHSLGGGLAQAMAAMLPEGINLKTHLVTFNGFGGQDALNTFEKVTNIEQRVQSRDFKKFQPTKDAISYRLENDPVSLMGEHFGDTRTIPNKSSAFNVLHNHSIKTITTAIENNPHLLTDSNYGGDCVPAKPITLAVSALSAVKGFINTDLHTININVSTYSACHEPYEALLNKSGKTCAQGNAEDCSLKGMSAKNKGDMSLAIESFESGCKLCHRDSCVLAAELNKTVGKLDETLNNSIAACDLGDTSSCIEAGQVTSKAWPKFDKSQNQRYLQDPSKFKYVMQGCALGDKSLCAKVPNPLFAIKYNNFKEQFCTNLPSRPGIASNFSILQCEIIFLSSPESNSMSKEERSERIKYLKENVNVK